MSSTPEQERDERAPRPEREGRDARIRQRVMHTLGLHDLPYTVQVRPLWGDHYRINVFVGAVGTSARIARSYFVQADAEGNIIESTPELAGLS
jgi:hypothetical protein